MKTQNWKWFRRVVLLLLMVALPVTCMTGCQKTKSVSSYLNGLPAIEVEWKENKQYPLNSVSLTLSIGMHDILDTDHGSYIWKDSDFFGVALYFCGPEFYEDIRGGEQLGEDRYLENYHFIKEISAEEALSGQYSMRVGLFNTDYQHSEELIIPSEILEEYDGSFCIKLVQLGIKDGNVIVAGSTPTIQLRYEIINDTYVVFKI